MYPLNSIAFKVFCPIKGHTVGLRFSTGKWREHYKGRVGLLDGERENGTWMANRGLDVCCYISKTLTVL